MRIQHHRVAETRNACLRHTAELDRPGDPPEKTDQFNITETLCVDAGARAEAHKHRIMEEQHGNYLLVTEGATPTKDGGIYRKIGGKTQVELVRKAAEGAEGAEGAATIIAIGSHAAWGDIQSADPNPAGARPTHEIIPAKTAVNIPGCPPNPYNSLSTVLYLLTFGKPPEFEGKNRPKPGGHYPPEAHIHLWPCRIVQRSRDNNQPDWSRP